MYRNVTQAFRDGLAQILANGQTLEVRGLEIKEIRPHIIRIVDPLERLYVLPYRNNNIFAAIAETIWVIAGRNDLRFLSYYLERAVDFSDDGKVWRAGYGPRLRNWQGVDQLAEVARVLNQDPNTRRAVMVLFDPRQDYITSKDIPCNNWLHFMIRDGKLHLHVSIRSNDVVWGFSGINTIEWSVLHEMMAFWTGSKVGDATYFITSYHLYKRHYKAAQNILRHFPPQTPYDFGFRSPEFSTSFPEFDAALAQWFEIEARMRQGEDVSDDIAGLNDDFLRTCLQMLRVYHQAKSRPESSIIADAIDQLPSSDLKIAAIEYFTRDAAKRDFVHLNSGETGYFVQHWAAQDTDDYGIIEATTFDSISKVLSILHYKKTLIYRDSWKRHGEVIGVFANIARKFDRLETIIAERVEMPSDETVVDTIADLAIYAAKYLTFLAEHYPLMFLSFVQDYDTTLLDKPFSENLEGFDPVMKLLLKRYDEETEMWKGIVSVDVCFEAVRKSYKSLEDLLLTQAWHSSDIQKCHHAASLAIAAVHCLILVAYSQPDRFSTFVDSIAAQ